MDSDTPAEAPQPFADLTPDTVLGAVEAFGLVTDGTLLALNSYENRVYQVGIEDAVPVVVKFYRPGRWSDAAILEEHAFSLELAEREIPVVAPLSDRDGHTLAHHQGYRFAVYPRRGGRWPELEDADNLRWLGRFIARIHAVGAMHPFRHRPTLDLDSYGRESSTYLLEHGLLPPYLEANYRIAAEEVLTLTAEAFEAVGPLRRIRLHGDCHPGNILWTDRGPHFVDLDDARMGPAVQDLWMLLSGSREDMSCQLGLLLEGYAEFYDFDPLEIHLIEALRALRLIHYAAWLARRWDDPAFPLAFPWFNTPRYWEEQLITLREQAERLQAPILEL